MTSTVDVIIPATRTAELLPLLAQLARESFYRSIIVVDDSRAGQIISVIKESSIRLVSTFGVGPGAARNAGAREATADWLLFLDDDVALGDGFGSQVRSALTQAPDSVGVIECSVIRSGPYSRPYWRNRIVESTAPGGFLTACLLVRRAAFSAVGGIAVNIFPRAFREDTDLALNVSKAGYSLQWNPDISVLHPIQQLSLRKFLSTARLFQYDAQFNRRHPGYLNRIGDQIRLIVVSARGFRRRVPLAAGAATLILAATPGVRPFAVVPFVISGIALNAIHLRKLRGTVRNNVAQILDPTELLPHALWSMVAFGSRVWGEVASSVAKLKRPDFPAKSSQIEAQNRPPALKG